MGSVRKDLHLQCITEWKGMVRRYEIRKYYGVGIKDMDARRKVGNCIRNERIWKFIVFSALLIMLYDVDTRFTSEQLLWSGRIGTAIAKK